MGGMVDSTLCWLQIKPTTRTGVFGVYCVLRGLSQHTALTGGAGPRTRAMSGAELR